MTKLPRITEIIKVEPFKVTCKWNTGEIRVIDFEPEFKKWDREGQALLSGLKEYSKFKYVTINESRTLCWPTITFTLENLKGELKEELLDLDPDVLYKISLPFENYVLVRNVA